MAKKLVKNYSFTPGVSLDANLRPDAYSLISQNRTFIIKEIVAYIQNQVDAGDPDYSGYTFSTAKCERDSGYVIDALLHDLRYGGNEQIHYVASQYWDGTVPQVDGSRIPEYEAYQFARDLINTYILTNTADLSPEQVIEIQVLDLSKTAESGSTTRVTTLLNNVVSVIENGLGSLPVLDIQLGRIEILGKIELEDLLLISNVTDNIVIYNFSDPSKGGTTEFFEGNTPSYPNATTVNNGVTVIRFKADTSSMSTTDSIQLFLENTELKVRPYDFGTDAIERMRVAQPQAMIDADFEYGLQPTKWQAIGMQRGYPATFEVSATDFPVVSVVTDASDGTGGIGSSLITVTTQGAHGLVVGSPITIRALASSVTGFNRAEGTFIIYSVPSSTTFTYYAKAKVGTSVGQVLATSTTQLRQADFYTGASVGVPDFSVATNGSGGTFTTTIQSASGSNTLSFTGAAPTVGAPLSSTTSGIPAGSQVAGVFGTANSDGIQDYRYVKTTYGSGVSAIDLVDVTDLSAGMGVGNEATPNILRTISSIVGNTLNLSGSVTVGHLGDENSYSGSATGVIGTGTGCTLDIDVNSGVYSVNAINAGGSGYQVGDTLYIYGADLGGTPGPNDLFLNVDSVSGGAVTAVTIITGTGTGTNSYTGVSTAEVASRGSGVTFNINRAGGLYINNGIAGGTNFFVGNRFVIAGTNFEGATPANDVTITVTSIGSGNAIASVSISGTAVRGDQIPVYATISMSENLTANFAANTLVTYGSIATIEVSFDSNHGFVPGMGLNIAITSTGTNHQLAGGPFSVEQVVDANTIRYTARSTGLIDTATLLSGSVYVRPDSFFSHRPFDGGVQLGTGGPQHGGQAIRQSKKYIRYQSGKGAMYNTGALFAPSFEIRSITSDGTASGSLITVITDDADHGLQSGSQIKINGIQTTGYDGTYTVNTIVDERTFTVVATTALGGTTGSISDDAYMSLYRWHGAVVRSGPFDDQNGIFFQYDGEQLAVGRRSSTFQLAGTIAIAANNNTVTGTNTRFIDQLQEGDRIVIRGMTHVVATIASNTSMTVTPDFRGVSDITGVKACKVIDIIVPQSQWNLDKCDGTGPSGYNVDITKMQMIGMQFSWYGAGFIDWMFRGPNGDYVFCHRLKGNNLNTEAYMRTGNLPVRYEVLNEGARSRLNGAIDDVATTITLDDVEMFPTSGTVYIDNELVSYSGKNNSTNQLTGCTRSANLSNFAAGATRTYTAGAAASHNDNQGVVLVSNTTSPIISHWGSAYLIDGLFDEDRGYIFNYASTGITATTSKNTAFLIRLAPSVSNAVTGDLGERELLNRAQLLLQAISVTSDGFDGSNNPVPGGIVIEGILNPQNYPTDPSKILWNGLTSQAAGGQPSFAQIALGGSVTWNSSAASTTTATVAGALTATITARYNNNTNYTRAFISGRNRFCMRESDYQSSGLLVGDSLVNASYLPAGTVVSSIGGTFTATGGSAGTSTVYRRINISNNATATSPSSTDISVTATASGTASSYVKTNFLYFTQATWEASGAIIGTKLDGSVTQFPANTTVTSINLRTLGGNSQYRVTFTQTSNATINSAATITFAFDTNYAIPGEQVFSFITQPGQSDTLDLGALKELGTTSIGGRGTFPNGPDVLAINIYKTSGADTTANVILRWGEAQA